MAKRWNSLIMDGMEVRGLVAYRRISSVKSDNLVVSEPSLMPEISALARRAISRCSIVKAYRRGNRGQPCRVPFIIEKGDKRVPFIWILADCECVKYKYFVEHDST